MRTGRNRYGVELFVCDICGQDTRVPAGEEPSVHPDDNSLEGRFNYQGAYGSTKHDLEIWQGEFCEQCTIDLRAHIDALAKARGGRGVRVVDMIEADGRYCKEVLGVNPEEHVRDRDFAKGFHAWAEGEFGLDI